MALPTYLAAGVEADKVEDMSQRRRLDDWLDSSWGIAAESDQSLLRYLGVS